MSEISNTQCSKSVLFRYGRFILLHLILSKPGTQIMGLIATAAVLWEWRVEPHQQQQQQLEEKIYLQAECLWGPYGNVHRDGICYTLYTACVLPMPNSAYARSGLTVFEMSNANNGAAPPPCPGSTYINILVALCTGTLGERLLAVLPPTKTQCNETWAQEQSPD